MKEKYIKPLAISNGQMEGVIPAAVSAAFPALVAGVAVGTQIKKMLNDGRSFHRLQGLMIAGEEG